MIPVGDAIWVNDAGTAGQKILFWQDGAVVEIWHGNHVARIGSIHHIRIDRLFNDMGRATGRLDDGSPVSVRIGKRDQIEVGQIIGVTITAAPRDGKAWQAIIGARLVSQNFVFLPDQAGLFTSKSIQTPPPAAVFSAIQSLLAKGGGGAILRRNAGMVDTPTLTAELNGLMALWDNGRMNSGDDANGPGMMHDGGTILAKAERYAPMSTSVICQDEDFTAAYDDAIDAASTTAIHLDGGGVIWIERTQALTAIDLDSGSGTLGEVITKAPALITRHLRLRSLTGLVVIDVPRASPAATQRFNNELGALFDRDPRRPEILGRTRGGVLECRIPHGHAPLVDQLADQVANQDNREEGRS